MGWKKWAQKKLKFCCVAIRLFKKKSIQLGNNDLLWQNKKEHITNFKT